MTSAVADYYIAAKTPCRSGCGFPGAAESGDHDSGLVPESALAQQFEDSQVIGIVAVHHPVIFFDRDIDSPDRTDCIFGSPGRLAAAQNPAFQYFAKSIFLEWRCDVNCFVIRKKLLPGEIKVRTLNQIVRPPSGICAGK